MGMTNQEAIEFLKNMIDREAIGFVCPEREGDVAIWQYHVEALQMAISALQEQDLQQNCNNLATDTISRQAAIDALLEEVRLVDGYYVENDEVIDKDDAIEAMRLLPSAQPEIIRCKNCKWWSNDDYRECSSPNYDDGYVTPAGFYCGYAERRTDERTD